MNGEVILDDTHNFYDEGQAENRTALPSSEDLFVSYMQHPHFQMYAGIGGLRGEQLRAIFGVAELARKEAANQRRQRERIEESENEATERVQRLCQALRSARRRTRSLTKTLRSHEARLFRREFKKETPFALPPSPLPTAPATPAPSLGTTPER